MKICVGVTGSIAAYRSPDLIKLLRARGHQTRVILTRSAKKLVSAKVLETFSGSPVLSNQIFSPDHKGTDHIESARWAELFIIYAASANFLARFALGLADDFLTLQLLATRAPIIVLPAMNPSMWEHPTVQNNVKTLTRRGVHFINPVLGTVACGETGVGHIAEMETLLAHELLTQTPSASPKPLLGKTLLISAGPMRTEIDPVRYIQNRSSGQMGLALVKEAKQMGATVLVLLGPVDDPIKEGFKKYADHLSFYKTIKDYGLLLPKLFKRCDYFMSLAAVLDFDAIKKVHKIDRQTLSDKGRLTFSIAPVSDWVASTVKQKQPHQKIIAFAAETAPSTRVLLARAKQKLEKKGVDAIVANPVRKNLGPEASKNELWIIQKASLGVRPTTLHLGPLKKSALARPLLTSLFLRDRSKT